jgi:hypothetical protein
MFKLRKASILLLPVALKLPARMAVLWSVILGKICSRTSTDNLRIPPGHTLRL